MAQGTRVRARVVMMPPYGTAASSWLVPRQKMYSSKGIIAKAATQEQVVMTMLGCNRNNKQK